MAIPQAASINGIKGTTVPFPPEAASHLRSLLAMLHCN